MSATEFNLLGEVMLEFVHSILGLQTLFEGDVGTNAGDGVIGPTLEVSQTIIRNIQRLSDHSNG